MKKVQVLEISPKTNSNFNFQQLKLPFSLIPRQFPTNTGIPWFWAKMTKLWLGKFAWFWLRIYAKSVAKVRILPRMTPQIKDPSSPMHSPRKIFEVCLLNHWIWLRNGREIVLWMLGNGWFGVFIDRPAMTSANAEDAPHEGSTLRTRHTVCECRGLARQTSANAARGPRTRS